MKFSACFFAFCAGICLVVSDQNTNSAKPVGALQSGISLNSSAGQDHVNAAPDVEKPFFSSCRDVPSNVSGYYWIRISNDSEPFLGYCDQEKLGGGWLLIQMRFDGSEDFYRNWTEYRDGFGDIKKEFWIGLERVHQLTVATPHQLMVKVRDFEEVNAYAWYEEFEIGSESEQYQLKQLGRYVGSAGDSMRQQEDMKFSTKDRDNDADSATHCAQKHEGAWWYRYKKERGGDCSDANLNGRYMRKNSVKASYWYHFNENNEGVKNSVMMIRPAKKKL